MSQSFSFVENMNFRAGCIKFVTGTVSSLGGPGELSGVGSCLDFFHGDIGGVFDLSEYVLLSALALLIFAKILSILSCDIV